MKAVKQPKKEEGKFANRMTIFLIFNCLNVFFYVCLFKREGHICHLMAKTEEGKNFIIDELC